MNAKLDGFVSQLQEQIHEETRTVLGEKGFERWQHPKYRGAIDNPDGYGRITGSCGDAMQVLTCHYYIDTSIAK